MVCRRTADRRNHVHHGWARCGSDTSQPWAVRASASLYEYDIVQHPCWPVNTTIPQGLRSNPTLLPSWPTALDPPKQHATYPFLAASLHRRSQKPLTTSRLP